MRITHLLILILVAATCVSLALPAFADGAATFKAKCVNCHGPEGQGKVGPAVKGTSLTADQIADLLTKGNGGKKPPHRKAMASISADDAKAVAEFVKRLK